MSAIATPSPSQSNQGSSPGNNSSAWSRGPPAATSKPTSAISTPTNPSGTPQPQAEVAHTNGSTNNASGQAPAGVSGHSRKGSIMVGGGIDIKRGSLAFGTVDSPNPLLSSSPAAPSITGTHLADAVKSFGEIDVDGSTDAKAVKATRGFTPGQPTVPGKQLNMHSLFGAKPKINGDVTSPPPPGASPNGVHDRRQSMSGQYPGPNPMGQMPMIPGQNHLRPPQVGSIPGQPRSPILGQFNQGGAQVHQQGFRPPQMQQQAYGRPNGTGPQMQPGLQRGGMMGPYNMNPGPQGPYSVMNYPNQGYYDGYNVYTPQQFGMPPQWAPQQHPQNQSYNMPLSPRNGPVPLSSPSPVPPPGGLSPGNGASPVPTPPTRPGSLITHHPTPSNVSVASIPSTPSRPMIPTSVSFTPPVPGQPSPFGLSGGASTFTPGPRASKAIKFSRPDGTALDIKEAAAAVKGPTPVATTPEPVAVAEEPPKKKIPSLPVVVRLESEEQKKARLKEQEEEAKRKQQEEQEERERKERRERKEAEEKRLKEEREAKQKMEEALAAEQAAAKKAEEEREVIAKQEKEEQEKVIAAAEEAREKADEKSRALLTPVPSTPSSPLASPALAAAGLPAKPTATALPRRPVPSALEIQQSPAQSEGDQPQTASALSTARPIEDLQSIVYPGTLKSPKPELNADAPPGKYRYDRDFLMQFMTVCREKPENLPPLEEIGLEAESSSGFGSRTRGSRSSAPGGSRGTPTGLGIGGLGNRPAFPGQGMGSFGMGQFGAGGSLRGSTSEERYNRSISQHKGMTRTPSQGGVLPQMGMSSSRSGTNRSRGGVKRAPQHTPLEPDVAPIVITQNSWVRSRPTGDDEGSPAYIERKVKSLLNKLTAEKFDSIASQILEWANKSASETDGMTLKLVIKQIFEKATDEAHWSSMYARLCKLLLEMLDPAITENFEGKPVSGGMLFRKYLVGRCQVDFEAGWKAREDAATAAAAKSEEDKERLAAQEKSADGEAAMLSDEYYVAQKAKRRGLGLIQLIGELYKLDMLGKGVIRQCFVKLLANIENPDEEDVESSIKLLTTVGAQFEKPSPENINIVFDRLQAIANSEHIAQRIKFMILDVVDLRRAGWTSKNKAAGVMTIAEIHQQAAKEQAEKSAAARESISRGGSRAGGRRDNQPGEWQSVAPTARPLQRPTDFSNIGRNISSTGMPNAPAFGPNSVFARGKGKPGNATPPISRQASTANMSNMFSALNDEPEPAGTERRGSAEAEPQRKKLELKPRTKPITAEGSEGEEEEAEAEEETAAVEVSTPNPATMSVDAAKTKIGVDMKELWGEKDAGGSRNPDDIVEYFRSLPEEHRPLLAEKLADDVFRISKIKDAEVVAAGWTRVLEEAATTKDVLIKGLEPRMPSLDDDSIDFPQAYKAIALLIRSISLSDDEIDALADKIDVYGEPRITPKQKLERALEAVDSEA